MKNIIVLLIAVLFLAVSCNDEMPKYESQEEVYTENLLVTTNSLRFTSAPSSQAVVIITHAEDISVSADQTWCIVSVDRTAEGKSLHISVTDNFEGAVPRTANVTVTAYNITKTIAVSQNIPTGYWYTIHPMEGDYMYEKPDYPRFFKRVDDMTFLTSYQNAGPADEREEWNENDPTNYPFLVRLKSLAGETVECDIVVENALWPYVYTPDNKIVIFDNTSTYNTVTQEFHLSFKTDWGNGYIETVNERVLGKRAGQYASPIPAVVESAWYTIEYLKGDYNEGKPEAPRYFKKIDDMTFATTYQTVGGASKGEEWDITDPVNHPFLVRLKSLTSETNVIDCDIIVEYPLWPAVYNSDKKIIVYDNASTYNTVTQEINLRFKTNWGIFPNTDYEYIETVNERAKNKRSAK